MGSEDLFAVGTSSLRGAVGVKDELPPTTVDTDVVMILADQGTIFDRGFATVGLMAQVMHVAINSRAAAPRPGASAVAQQDGAANVGGDRVTVADVQRE